MFSNLLKEVREILVGNISMQIFVVDRVVIQ